MEKCKCGKPARVGVVGEESEGPTLCFECWEKAGNKPKRGRPPKPEDDHLVAFNIRVPLAVKKKLDRIPASRVRDELERVTRQAFDPSSE